jgi:hypothetical protein
MPRLSQDNQIPTAISNIKLCFALKNCGKTPVKDAFDKSCDENLYVYDNQERCYTDWDCTEPEFVSKCFIAKNPNKNTIVLLPLDNRVITGQSLIVGGVCDGMLLTDKEMCLVEFKTNATSDNQQTIKGCAEKGIKQLWHTLKIIKEKCYNKKIDIENLLSIDFYIVFDKELMVTSETSELQDLRVQFVEDNKYKLYFKNEKEFK